MPVTVRLPLLWPQCGLYATRLPGVHAPGTPGSPRAAYSWWLSAWLGSAVTGGGRGRGSVCDSSGFSGAVAFDATFTREVGDRMQETSQGLSPGLPALSVKRGRVSRSCRDDSRVPVLGACDRMTPMHSHAQHVLARSRPRRLTNKKDEGVVQRGRQVFCERRPPWPVTGSRFLPGEGVKKPFSDVNKYEIIYQNLCL